MYRDTYLEINLDKIGSNVKNLIDKYNQYNYYFGVIKGNAYGHGYYIVNTLIENGINYIAVSNLEEAMNVRKLNNEIPILCLEPIDIKWINKCVEQNITITISNLQYVKQLCDLKLKNLKVHIKIDSGMNRLGFNNNKDLIKAINLLKRYNFILEGIYTHMASLGISDPYRKIQLNNFDKIVKNVDLTQFKIIHIDRSLTCMCNKKIKYANGVRFGISIYGYNQIPKLDNSFKGKLRKFKAILRQKKYHIEKYNFDRNIELYPALSLYSKIIEIKTVHNGEFIGYLGYEHTGKDIQVATVCIGYADGIDLNAHGGYVFINKQACKIIGTVNMGMISIIVNKNVKIGDKVEIIGDNANIRNLSNHCGTTIYKTMTCISPLLPRVYIKNNKVINTNE